MTTPKKPKRPSLALRRLLSPLLLACRKAILTAPPQTDGKTVLITVAWGDVKLPEGFPKGVPIKGGVRKHKVESLLAWFKDNLYCDYNAKDLFAMRLPIMMVNAKLETNLMKLLDIDKQFLYNDAIE